MEQKMARTRAYRRAQATRVKARTRRTVRIWGGAHCVEERYTNPDSHPAWFGVCVSTHCRPCSCHMCSPYWEDKSPRDLREEATLREAMADADVLPSVMKGAL